MVRSLTLRLRDGGRQGGELDRKPLEETPSLRFQQS